MRFCMRSFLPGKNNVQKFKSMYLKRFEHYPFRSKVLNTTGAVLSALGVYAGGAFYENSYYKRTRDGDISYVEPVQKNFDSRGEAINYAKQRVIEGLNKDSAYEHMVYINNADNEILAEFKGNDETVAGTLSLADEIKIIFDGKGYSAVHGHPENSNGTTNPLGFLDFKSLMENKNLTEICAVNKYGEVSRLRKGPDFKPISTEQIDSMRTEMLKLLNCSFKYTSGNLHDKILQEYKETEDSLSRTKLISKYESLLQEQAVTPFFHNLVHRFWEKCAPFFGLEYYTNYTDMKTN